MRPAIAEATRLPKDWIAASSPNADPRISSGASAATAACSAVSTNPMAIPASRKGANKNQMLVVLVANPR